MKILIFLHGTTIMHKNAFGKTREEYVKKDKFVLKKYGFPDGQVFYCKEGKDWQNVIEKAKPDIIIEDDCESIGGESEMTYPNLKPKLKAKIKSIVVKEFSGIDHFPDDIKFLRTKK